MRDSHLSSIKQMKLSLIHSTGFRQFIRDDSDIFSNKFNNKKYLVLKLHFCFCTRFLTLFYEANVISLIDYRNPNDDKLMNEIYAPDQICTNKNSINRVN